jgi:hypothetical protein
MNLLRAKLKPLKGMSREVLETTVCQKGVE